MRWQWKDLLERRRVERRAPDADEIRELLAAVDRQLANARLDGLTPDGRLQHAFSAARLGATVALRAEGYRTRGVAHHETTFLALEVIGPPLAGHAAPCQALRYLRIDVEYSGAEVTEAEASEALAVVTAFRSDLHTWLRRRHPRLAR